MTTADTRVTNWGGNVAFRAVRVHRPRALDELRRIVATTRRVRALGSGHSFSLVADTTADLVRLDRLPASVEIAPDGRTATVAAGMRYAEVALALHRAGYALGNMASLPHISVGGSCATGTHGSGNTQRCLAAAVCGLDVVGPDGEVLEVRRDTEPDTFPGWVVALGALGVAVRLRLSIEPAYEVAQWVRVAVPWDEVAADFDAVSGAGYSVSVFTDWLAPTASVWLKCRTDQPAPRWAGGYPADEPVHPVPGMPPDLSTEQLGVPGPWYKRLPHFRPELTPGAGRELQSEFYVAREDVRAAFAAVREVGARVARVLHIAEIRTVRADDLWLSPAYGRDSVTLHFTWHHDLSAVLPVLHEVEERLMALGARPHWGKMTVTPPRYVVARYERAEQFAALMRKYDPDGKFRNAFVDNLFPSG